MSVTLPSHFSFQPITCDSGVAEMILEFYGLPFSFRSISQFLKLHFYGTYPTELAECLRAHGVQTTLLTANRSLFSTETWRIFLQHLTEESNPDLPAINEFERVMKQGVYLRQQLPTIEMLQEELAHRRPVILVFTAAPQRPELDRCCHFAVLTELDETHATMIDAFPERTSRTLPIESLLSIIQQPTQTNPFSGMVILTSKTAQPKKE